MCAVGHYLEEEGIATTLISLVREHSDAMAPPRSLWVPFMLGRPFGVPDDAAFQSRVLRAALALLEAPSGPVTKEFPEAAPDASAILEDGAACPVHFNRPPLDQTSTQARLRALHEEIAQLQPWHDLALRTRGRSTVGVSGQSIEDAATFIASQLDAQHPAEADAPSHARRIKLACDDLRAFYEEAGAAQPGQLTPAALERWYYLDTLAGRMLHDLRDHCMRSDLPALQHLGKLVLIPRAVLHASPPVSTTNPDR